MKQVCHKFIWEKAASQPLTAENELAHCMCNAHCRQIQLLSHLHATSTLHRQTDNNGIYRTSITSCYKNTPNSNLAHI